MFIKGKLKDLVESGNEGGYGNGLGYKDGDIIAYAYGYGAGTGSGCGYGINYGNSFGSGIGYGESDITKAGAEIINEKETV